MSTPTQTLAQMLEQALDNGTLIAPPSQDDAELTLERAYAVQNALTARRLDAGAHIVGFKAGFTNQRIWPEYGIDAPIHGPILSTTLATSPQKLGPMPQPKIEPEIALRLRARPQASMTDADLLSCVEAVAAAFEIVQCPYPGWRATAPDMVAAAAAHGALVLGPWQAATADWLTPLTRFGATLSRDGSPVDTGTAATLLGAGPLAVLRHLAAMTPAPDWAPGHVISTGTVTRAFDCAPGQTWTVDWQGIALPPLTLSLA